ncbi:MAG: hypothetical protein GF416_09105 [Candidatus Altiarchaeales archaeon]|nr:hypothetical protein [Candidatus Altiarchaeales archaeon]MBD3417276.1 hypothetical protein [Candidatus Altiarchaeales archaeon]
MVNLRRITVLALLLIIVSTAAQTQYTCQTSNPPSCSGTCPKGQACTYKFTISHPGGYCTCADATTTTTTVRPCTLNQKSNTCEGYCPNNLQCTSYYGKCTCIAPTTTVKATTTTLKPSVTTTLKPAQTTTTLKYAQTTTTQMPTVTIPPAIDIITTYPTTTQPQNPTTIHYTKTPAIPLKGVETVAYSMQVGDLDGIRMVKLIVNRKTVETCYPRGAAVASCVGNDGPYGSKAMLQIQVTDDFGNVETIDGSVDVQDGGGPSGGCPAGCACMTAASANLVFAGNFEQCSSTPCGSVPGSGGDPGTVVDGGPGSGGTPDTPMYCYRPGPTCPSGCECLTAVEAAAGGIGGLSYRPCQCAVQSCGTGRMCYELGCRPIKGDLTPFREEHATHVLVRAEHQTSGAERIMPAAWPLNGSTENPKLVYSGCLSEGLWEVTPIYNEVRLCENCLLSGSWIPPATTVDATDLCGPQIERNFHYDLLDPNPPLISLSGQPQTFYYSSKPNITAEASDDTGIHRIRLYESGIDTECNEVEERYIGNCCFTGESNVACSRANRSLMNYSTVMYRAVACDMAGNTNETTFTKKVAVNETNLKIGTLCSCREGIRISLPFERFDDLAVGDLLPGARDELAYASVEEGRVYVILVNGSRAANLTSVYSQYDRLAVSDVVGDERAEILIANSEDGNVYVYDAAGTMLSSFNADFEQDDGFIAGDLVGDGKSEMVVVKKGDDTAYLYDSGGFYLTSRGLGKDFKGVRYHGDAGGDDGAALADLFGDGKKELAIAYNSDDTVSVFSDDTLTERISFRLERFTPHDRLTAGNMVGDGKDELVVGVDDDGAVYVYDMTGPLKVNYFPWTKYDSLACGELLEGGNDEYVVAIDEDGIAYVEYGEDAPVGVGV